MPAVTQTTFIERLASPPVIPVTIAIFKFVWNYIIVSNFAFEICKLTCLTDLSDSRFQIACRHLLIGWLSDRSETGKTRPEKTLAKRACPCQTCGGSKYCCYWNDYGMTGHIMSIVSYNGRILARNTEQFSAYMIPSELLGSEYSAMARACSQNRKQSATSWPSPQTCVDNVNVFLDGGWRGVVAANTSATHSRYISANYQDNNKHNNEQIMNFGLAHMHRVPRNRAYES